MDRDKVVARANELLDSNPKPYMYRNEVVPGFLARQLIIEFEGIDKLDSHATQCEYRELCLLISFAYRPNGGI